MTRLAGALLAAVLASPAWAQRLVPASPAEAPVLPTAAIALAAPVAPVMPDMGPGLLPNSLPGMPSLPILQVAPEPAGQTKPEDSRPRLDRVFDGVKAVAIIGAGPAGLSLARELVKRGVDAVVLEKAAKPGDSWRRMPDRLHLLSPWAQVKLPDSPDSIKPSEDYVPAGRYAQYLDEYAAHHRLPVMTGAAVAGVERQKDGTYKVRVHKDGAEQTVRAGIVVNATGYFGKPKYPVLPGAAASSIPQVHFAQYKNAAQIRALTGAGRKVLIVGKRLSAGQVMVELDEAGFSVALGAVGPVEFLPPSPWREYGEKFWPAVEKAALALGLGSVLARDVPMEGGKTKELIESGRVRVLPRPERIDGRLVVFENGSREVFDAIVYATGFEPATAHLGAQAKPNLKGMESAESPGLFFIGLDKLRDFRSRFIRGIREDAKALANILAARVKGR